MNRQQTAQHVQAVNQDIGIEETTGHLPRLDRT
jgi:hypothetical protein